MEREKEGGMVLPPARGRQRSCGNWADRDSELSLFVGAKSGFGDLGGSVALPFGLTSLGA
jgi:hypothetical protein